MDSKNDFATLSITIDRKNASPLYLQLTKQLRQLILSNRLSSGEQLPPSRKLAQLLSISRTSTLNAYDQLIAEGLLVTRPSAGVFVSTVSKTNTFRDTRDKQHHSKESSVITPPKKRKIPQWGFDSGPDAEIFPHVEWSRSLSRVWKQPDPALLRESNIGGYFPLRQAIARYINAVRGVECLPEQVIVTAGNRDALSLITKALLKKGDKVALENPCFSPLRHGFEAQELQVVNCPVDAEGMTLPNANVDLAWSTPARQYPLGITMSTERRLEWLALAQQTGCWMVEDDFDSEFQYGKTPPTPIYNLAAKLLRHEQQPIILVGSLSKLMFKTLRLGYLIVPLPLVNCFLNTQESLGNMAAIPAQPALAEFLGHRHFASHLRRMRRCYQNRRDYLYQLINSELKGKVSVELPDCGMHLLTRIKTGVKGQEDSKLSEVLKSKGIYTPALSTHYIDEGEQGLLLGFSGFSEPHLKRGVQCIKDNWHIKNK